MPNLKLIVSTLALSLCACGGGGGNSKATPSEQPSPAASASPETSPSPSPSPIAKLKVELDIPNDICGDPLVTNMKLEQIDEHGERTILFEPGQSPNNIELTAPMGEAFTLIADFNDPSNGEEIVEYRDLTNGSVNIEALNASSRKVDELSCDCQQINVAIESNDYPNVTLYAHGQAVYAGPFGHTLTLCENHEDRRQTFIAYSNHDVPSDNPDFHREIIAGDFILTASDASSVTTHTAELIENQNYFSELDITDNSSDELEGHPSTNNGVSPSNVMLIQNPERFSVISFTDTNEHALLEYRTTDITKPWLIEAEPSFIEYIEAQKLPDSAPLMPWLEEYPSWPASSQSFLLNKTNLSDTYARPPIISPTPITVSYHKDELSGEETLNFNGNNHQLLSLRVTLSINEAYHSYTLHADGQLSQLNLTEIPLFSRLKDAERVNIRIDFSNKHGATNYMEAIALHKAENSESTTLYAIYERGEIE
ncbi:hypothetical protein [Agaribacterium sp. ZY112]|uniref:hypothetical protein n=1 Tax=Agaribacterium sp. ZY112 TaxID=3233574 RepID=UPI0035256CDF